MPDPTTTDLWGTHELDLTAYLDRLGQPEREPSREALAGLHRAHRLAFPFENLDVLLDQHPGVSVAAVQTKFLGKQRGGYCFEHGVLFAAALERLGYAVDRPLSRVGDPLAKPRTHLVVIVDLEGDRLLCDPGMGWTLYEPLDLVDGAEATQDGWRFRLARREVLGEPMWELSRLHGTAWEAMHWVDESVIRPVDVELAHHWTNAHPTSHFRSTLRVTGTTRTGSILGISLDGVTERRPGEPTTHQELTLTAHEIGRQLARIGIRPTYEELDRLEAKVLELAGRTA